MQKNTLAKILLCSSLVITSSIASAAEMSIDGPSKENRTPTLLYQTNPHLRKILTTLTTILDNLETNRFHPYHTYTLKEITEKHLTMWHRSLGDNWGFLTPQEKTAVLDTIRFNFHNAGSKLIQATNMES
ncbi:MAG: hypothetical protein H6679_01380 [Epsilonproteobacteria bacterium]|nr:hypothetical protein [Campylobacterota bacterium]